MTQKSKHSRTQLKKLVWKLAYKEGLKRGKAKALEVTFGGYKNTIREETIDRIKAMPWWVRLFNKFEV